ncbi:hypothetical protein N7517_007802 [Penicillium concentricum]|uniref:Uncharacterized protein n=1 Tax=Penicillium concentricum TaxID=293559 RepID=A0A9W9SBW6_9EURO|nr:uncharacterized protein N7517_007802 [Penicillium concentricum]KAJ5375796.1 hypothetical protein N7517_007802 [Penicillium concentricum]
MDHPEFDILHLHLRLFQSLAPFCMIPTSLITSLFPLPSTCLLVVKRISVVAISIVVAIRTLLEIKRGFLVAEPISLKAESIFFMAERIVIVVENIFFLALEAFITILNVNIVLLTNFFLGFVDAVVVLLGYRNPQGSTQTVAPFFAPDNDLEVLY